MALAEQMSEVRVHDLVTKSFRYRPIDRDYDSEVHASVGDAVIVTWPLNDDPQRNARATLFFHR